MMGKRGLRLPVVVDVSVDKLPSSTPVRLFWMFVIWAVSVCALAAVAGLLKLALLR